MKQFLITIRLDIEDNEHVENFFYNWIDPESETLDPEMFSQDNHEVIEREEITDQDSDS